MASASNPRATRSLLLSAFISLLFLSLSNGAFASHHSKTAHAPAPAPAPTQDCSEYLVDLFDCIDFVEQGSNSTNPTASCCAGLKKVVRENERCLCDLLDSNKDYGIKLNMSRAVALPSACGVSTPNSSKCKTSVAPANAPGSKGVATPSPSPVNSFAVTLPISAFAAVAGIAIYIFSLTG